jgi:hypothetical protein
VVNFEPVSTLLDAEIKAELPLKRIWTVAVQEKE